MKKFFFMLLTVTPISAIGIEAAHITAAYATSPTGATLSPTGANMAVISPNSLNSAQIMQIQQTLRNDGYVVNLNGVWGPSITTALQQFQVARGLPGTGTLTAQTVTSLGVNLGTIPAPVGSLPQGTVQGSAAVNNSISPAAGGTASPTAAAPLSTTGSTPLRSSGSANTTTSGTATVNGMSGTASGAVSGGASAPSSTGSGSGG